MKVLHVADTHLGYSAYRKVTDDGINQREIDVYDAFKQFVDYAIKSKTNLVIHAGDLFDSVRPNNRAITFALKQILRLSKHDIPFVVIAGNHEHPKLKETGHIFSIFDHIENVYPVYSTKYEIISLTINREKINIHSIPHSSSKDEFNNNFDKLKKDSSSDYNVLMTHGCIKGIKEFSMNEFNELMIPKQCLISGFDYVALGHYHKYTEVSKNTFYAGSTECFSFADAGEKKGFIELELIRGEINHRFIELKNRSMINSIPISCSNLKLDEVMKKINENVDKINPKDKVFRIILEDVPSHIYRGIDFNAIRELSSKAVHYEIKADMLRGGDSKSWVNSKIDALTLEFETFLDDQDIKEKENLLKLGMKYIGKVEAREKEK